MVTFDLGERDLGELLACALPTKAIAGALEIALQTCYDRIDDMCTKTHVIGRSQLALWILQNPDVLRRGGTAEPGLHPDTCDCGKPGCLGRIAERLLRRP